MSCNLVFIMNGENEDCHCGKSTYYSPIIYDGGDGLSVCDSIKISCTSWMKPSDYVTGLKNDVRYLISKDERYGYKYNDAEIYFPKFMSSIISQELKNLLFTQYVYPHY